MSIKFDKLRKDWKEAGYTGYLMLPIKIDDNQEEIRKEMLNVSLGLGDYHKFMDFYQKSGKQRVGEYLNRICRDAVAHGKLSSKTIKSQENFKDYFEMYFANQFIKSAAFLAIMEHLNTEITVE